MSEPASDALAIAIVEDEPVVRRLMRLWLEADGLRVVEYGCGKDAMDLDTDGAALVCLDLQLEDMPGQAVLAHFRERDPDLPVIVVTGDQDLETAARAMIAGAYEFVTKPFDQMRLGQAVRRALERRDLALKIRRLEQALGQAGGSGRAGRAGASSIVGSSAAMQALAGEIERAALAPVDGEGGAAVMIIGESGTGKELVARAIHERRGGRGPFVLVSCATIPEASHEAELFGHGEDGESGGGRFEEARSGTLFLDAIGEMSAAAQARLICATTRDLESAARSGRFRADLHALLSARVIRLPRLRDRSDDIPLLVAHFLRALREDVGREVTRVEPEAMDALMRGAWPGNVRELQNVVHRAMLASDGESIKLADLPPHIRDATAAGALAADGAPASGAAPPESGAEVPSSEPAPSIDAASPLNLRELERAAITRALKLAGGSVGKAAKLLGIGRATLYRRLSGQREPLNGAESDDLPEREVARS
jgi:DNA-binding NtrC family response regulator